MLHINRYDYFDYNKISDSTDRIIITDHLDGFDVNYKNAYLEKINTIGQSRNRKLILETSYILHEHAEIKNKYKFLDFRFSNTFFPKISFLNYKNPPEVDYKNFICSFNGSDHVSRKLLTACLHKMKLFHPDYCSKNYAHSLDKLDGYITDYVGIDDRYYRKFFISEDSDSFFQTLYSFGHLRFDHANNIYNLENKLTESFVHIVSETIATSYYPFVTEKFLYSIVTKGLFLAYAHPGWHAHVEKYYGFKLYTKLFDYRFDSIKNPIERLVSLIEMIYKFKSLSNDELYDLYLTELDTINYNYDHYYSGDWHKRLDEIKNAK